jgi:hypothetical protein
VDIDITQFTTLADTSQENFHPEQTIIFPWGIPDKRKCAAVFLSCDRPAEDYTASFV